jgi:hypothetical protein
LPKVLEKSNCNASGNIGKDSTFDTSKPLKPKNKSQHLKAEKRLPISEMKTDVGVQKEYFIDRKWRNNSNKSTN